MTLKTKVEINMNYVHGVSRVIRIGIKKVYTHTQTHTWSLFT